MTQFIVSAKINSTVSASVLCYTMQIHHNDGYHRFDVLPITDVTELTEDYQTQQHKTIDLFYEYNHSVFIMSMMFYRKLANGSLVQLTKRPIITSCVFNDNHTFINEIEVYFNYQEYLAITAPNQHELTKTTKLMISTPQTVFMAEHPLGSQYNPFTADIIEKSIHSRIQGRIGKFDSPIYPSEGDAPHLSGAAAFFYCLLKTRPDLYLQIIKNLFETGRASLGLLDIRPNDETRRPQHYFYTEKDFKYGEQLKLARYLHLPKVPPIDWISLSSLYDSLAQEKQDGVWPVVTASQMKTWFDAVGSTTLISYMDLNKLTLDKVCEAHQFIYRQHHILTLIDSSILIGGLNESEQLIWVVWADKLRLNTGVAVSENTDLSENVELELYAQGNVKQYLKKNLSLKVFLQNLRGFMLFSKIL